MQLFIKLLTSVNTFYDFSRRFTQLFKCICNILLSLHKLLVHIFTHVNYINTYLTTYQLTYTHSIDWDES